MAALRFVRSGRSRPEPHTVTGRVVTQSDIDKVGATKDGLVRVGKAGDAVSNDEASGEDDGTRPGDEALTEEGETTARDKDQPEEGAVTPPNQDGTTKGDTEALEKARATEGDATPLDVVPAEEGDEVATPATSCETSSRGTGQLGEGPAAEQPSAIDSLAKVRAVAKQAKKEAKRQRVERAARRSNRGVAEVELAVVTLSDEQRVRRRQQAKAARMELAQRQMATRKTSANRASAKVSLVQSTHDYTATKESQVKGIAADDGLPTATMPIDAERVAIKLDCGARYSVAGTDWMPRGERLRKDAPVDCVEGIGGFLLNVLGVWAFTMRNAYGQLVEMEACIVEGCTDEFLIGVDFLRRHQANMDFECNEVKYFDHDKLVIIPFRTEGEDGDAKVAAVRLVKQSRLVRSAVTPVEVMVTAPDGEEGIFVPTQRCGTVMMAATVTTVKGGKAWIPVINVHGGRTKLPAKKELGTWVPVDADMQLLKMNGELKTDKVEEWLAMLGDCETPLDNEDEVQLGTENPNSQRLVLKLLRAYRKVSKQAGDCPPVTALDVEHHIDTGSEKPIMLKRRRHAQSEDAIMEDNVSKMLRAGVIEEGNGAWGFPVVLVRKKDGEVRFCVDYRALNKVTKRDVYPLPRIDETLEALGGARLFTTLDLKAGYWQISVASEDRDKTAFTTKQGLYRFVRMPFGLMNAPSTFQRMMNGVLRGLTWSTCLVYLDDIVVYTRGGIERHVIELASVLERLSTAGLTLKLKKCVFAAASMEYLGHELSSEGVRPVERVVTAVREFPRPSDPTEVKRFVHLAGYYRKFIGAFGSIMAPLTRLLKKSSEWEWTEEQEFAFERVKAALTTRPLFVYPNFELPFRLVTDASKTGLGACLMQDQGRGWQPVAFASKVNSSAEANYSITELECLAVVWAVKLFRPYLYGRAFTIITDHSALKWLMTRPNLAGRLHRWSLTLQEYEFEILYRPGATNVVADALSRVPPLRSIHGGEVGDRWALDVAGPFPVADGGERYVIAALEYVTRYAVARSVTHRTAKNVATFLMEDVVLRFGAFRELLTDGAPELTGEVIEKLVDLLQARQVNPVPYRPQMVGLVERFHRSWKDCVATYMANEQQNDWNLWVKLAVYAYNSANHSTVALTPNELMMGRRLRAPNELLRSTRTSEEGELPSYHARLVTAMVTSREHAEVARTKEQERQARYYNKKARQGRVFNPGDRVWVYNPPRGAKATKFVHRWMGPACIVEATGYDNFLLRREDKGGTPELIIAHVSFLVSYHSPEPLLERAAADIDAQLEYEEQGRKDDGEADAEAVRAAATPTKTTTVPRMAKATARRGKRKRKTMGGSSVDDDKGGRLVEVRRRRNRAGQYVLEYELRPISNWQKAAAGKWVSCTDYDRLFASGRVVEDPAVEEGV